jgi:hydroxyacylglutathione hydrolase
VEIVALAEEGLGNNAYLVNLGDGGALIVDPVRDPRRYLHELERRALTPRFVVETHLHADFVSGGRELAARGARLLAPAGSDLAFDHEPLQDGEELDLGGLRLQVIATPGHTPEHLAYLLLDGSRPVALFSGGTLLAGGVARTDLLTPEQTEPLARAAYRSITTRLLTLPDGLPVYPTHGGGSFCSTGPSSERTSTIGQERARNPLLVGEPDEDTFVSRLLAGFGSYPPYFLELREVNRAGPTVHGRTPPPLPQLTVSQVEALIASGAELVDVRHLDAFADGHVPGSLSIPWRAQFATWLGWLVSRDKPVVFVADDELDRDDLVWAAATIGYERLVGELAGGVGAWQAAGGRLARTALLTPQQADGATLVDVRQRSEWDAGHLADATHVELGQLVHDPGRVPDGPVLVHCGHGERAMSAASLLERAGRRDVGVVVGGPDDLGDLEVAT